jgi:hypothetical protein
MRFYDALSKEALVVTKTEAIKEMLTLKPDDFGHPKNVQYLMHRLTGSRFSFLSPHGHKVGAVLFQGVDPCRACT